MLVGRFSLNEYGGITLVKERINEKCFQIK
jgi:hypothetical protein